jgi:diaminopimelate epimerase
MNNTIYFYKFHGAGNDFILIDNRDGHFDVNPKRIAAMCHRRLGIGADGLMLLNASERYAFEMMYFNADGKEGTMCGNGGRSIVAFAQMLGVVGEKCEFSAIDGIHIAEVLQRDNQNWEIKLQLNDVNDIKQLSGTDFFLDTGSPHFVRFVDRISDVNVKNEGKKLRYDRSINEAGSNVNFVEQTKKELFAVTYERGVEDITLSCGTGVTAVAIVQALRQNLDSGTIPVRTDGGLLQVSFQRKKNSFENIFLQGPVQLVFEGKYQY